MRRRARGGGRSVPGPGLLCAALLALERPCFRGGSGTPARDRRKTDRVVRLSLGV